MPYGFEGPRVRSIDAKDGHEGELDSSESPAEHAFDPTTQALKEIEVAAALPNIDPTENLDRGREILSAITDPAERSSALTRYAKSEIEAGFIHDVANTIERIENPRERFAALLAWHDECVRIETRVWSPGDILELAKKSVQEMGDAGQSAEILTRLASIAASYQTDIAIEIGNRIREPEQRARAFRQLAASHTRSGRPYSEYVEEAEKAEARQ